MVLAALPFAASTALHADELKLPCGPEDKQCAQKADGGRVVTRYGSCWSEVRCAAKRRILEAFLR